MTHKLEFDAIDHTYHLDGSPVPSVTQVLGDIIPGWHAEEWYLQRGTAVHACAALVAQGQPFLHDPQIDGQVAAVRRFFREVQPEVIACEERVYSARHRYAGTLDLIAKIAGTLTLIDWKASISKSVPYQLAAYALAYSEPVKQGRIRRGVAVQLKADGTYRMSETYDLRRYEAGFLAMLGAHNIRRECGIIEEN